jgi:hypothetical protein
VKLAAWSRRPPPARYRHQAVPAATVPQRRARTDAGRCGTDQRTKMHIHGERENMREPALIAVTLGACLDGPSTRTCRGFPWRVQEAAGRLGLMRLMRLPQQMRHWPKEHQFSGFVRSAAQHTTLSGRSGPELIARTDSFVALKDSAPPSPCPSSAGAPCW